MNEVLIDIEPSDFAYCKIYRLDDWCGEKTSIENGALDVL